LCKDNASGLAAVGDAFSVNGIAHRRVGGFGGWKACGPRSSAEFHGSIDGVPVAFSTAVAVNPFDNERRAGAGDRRRHSRSGRRASDPHTNWRGIAWLFALYAAYVSLRTLPSTIKERLRRAHRA